eukprot:CAMPEP_0118896544 /NCGR_PEP_ID=MMETSP1166-20130328/4360_1 /TAXON_ID=1104430 /ORGANISM="Chrysoreinhardia sp, Strain CCMP3193" /LENGTH=208 /DNA_ID=CAMNT_0006835603 /DNA_START=46 /DNA_END=672 /DNA_ORIENTATION=+
MTSAVSFQSDRKKYNYAGGLQRDLLKTRAALRAVEKGGECRFGDVFTEADGAIANLTRALQNLRREGEISFEKDMLFQGVDDGRVITLKEPFFEGAYAVDKVNVFRAAAEEKDIDDAHRRGRSYDRDNDATRHLDVCATCGQPCPFGSDRIALRGAVYHFHCLSCANCGAALRGDYLSFDGRPCCSSACIQAYDAKHLRQARDSSSSL